MTCFDIIIIGTGLAGYTLAKHYRTINKTSTIVMISFDDGCYYSKPMLSTGFAKNKSAEQLAMKSAEQMAQELDVTILAHSQVESIDRNNKSLTLQNAQSLQYQQALVFATGAAPIEIPLPQALAGRTFAINDLQDYHQFREHLFAQNENPKVAIIGSGLVGCEYANDLMQANVEIDVISLDKTPLQQLLPATLGDAVQQQLTDKGINWHLDTSIKDATELSNGQLQLSLHSGATIDCDIVLSAVGLKPRDQLAVQAGVKAERGIVVDQYLKTNDPHIFALGDCARINGINLMYVAILTLAAKALAKTLNNEPTQVVMPANPVIVKTPSCPVVANPPPLDTAGDWQIEGESPDLKACFYDKNQQLVGFGLTGKKVMERMKLAKELPAVLAAC